MNGRDVRPGTLVLVGDRREDAFRLPERTTIPMMTWQRAIADYRTAMNARALSPRTIDCYEGYLQRAGVALDTETPWVVTTQQIEHLIGSMTSSASGRKSMRTALGGFYAWGLARGYLAVDPAAPVPTPRVPKGRPRPTPEGVLLDALERADDRERLMVELGALAGLRASEIAQVHQLDLNEDDELLVHGKGGKERIVPLVAGHLVDAIRAADGWVFPNVQRGGHLTPNHVTHILSRLLDGPWTGHTLRHRFGTRAYAVTRDLLAVSELLGHESPNTTLTYVKMPKDHLVDAVAAAVQIGALPPRRPRGHDDELPRAA